jgi:hypothetical protein
LKKEEDSMMSAKNSYIPFCILCTVMFSNVLVHGMENDDSIITRRNRSYSADAVLCRRDTSCYDGKQNRPSAAIQEVQELVRQVAIQELHEQTDKARTVLAEVKATQRKYEALTEANDPWLRFKRMTLRMCQVTPPLVILFAGLAINGTYCADGKNQLAEWLWGNAK